MINGLKFQSQLENFLFDYSEEINQYRLSTQLQILKTKFVDFNEKNRFCSNKLYEKQHISIQADFYLEIIVLLKLYLVPAAANAVSERSASTMSRIKNWLRSTMSQERLNIVYCFQYTKKKLMK